MQQFQSSYEDNGSLWGVGGATPRVVVIYCFFEIPTISPGRLKRSPGSRGLKNRRWAIGGWQGSTEIQPSLITSTGSLIMSMCRPRTRGVFRQTQSPPS